MQTSLLAMQRQGGRALVRLSTRRVSCPVSHFYPIPQFPTQRREFSFNWFRSSSSSAPAATQPVAVTTTGAPPAATAPTFAADPASASAAASSLQPVADAAATTATATAAPVPLEPSILDDVVHIMDWLTSANGANMSVWVATVVVATGVRLLLSPMIVQNKKYGLYMAKARPILMTYSMQMRMLKEAGTKLTPEMVKELTSSRDAEFDKILPGLRVYTPFIYMIPLIMVQFYFFLGMRRYYTDIPREGFWWIPNLTEVDPYGVLSVALGIVLSLQLFRGVRTMESGMDGEPNELALRLLKWNTLCLPPIVAVTTSWLPSGLVLYFAANAFWLFLQASLMDTLWLRSTFGLLVLNATTGTVDPQKTAPVQIVFNPSAPPAAVAAATPSSGETSGQGSEATTSSSQEQPSSTKPSS